MLKQMELSPKSKSAWHQRTSPPSPWPQQRIRKQRLSKQTTVGTTVKYELKLKKGKDRFVLKLAPDGTSIKESNGKKEDKV